MELKELTWLFSLIFSIFSSCSGNSTIIEEYRIVKTLNGEVRGKLSKTLFDEMAYYSFRGIPYANPPVGNLRFKPPMPIANWTDIKDAFDYGSECVQKSALSSKVIGSENCLYLNIFVPNTPFNEKHAVMFYIHGGGFVIGSGDGYGPDFLINQDVILVTINYRLSAFGFMSLGTPEYSGNMGLKDQLMALKWINENIQYFGGDKSRITIFGESAGGASVHFHTMSPKSRGLFQRAIMQSGSVLNPWALYLYSSHLNIMKDFGERFGNITGNNTNDLIQYLENVSAEKLHKELRYDLYTPGLGRKISNIVWSPIIEVSNALDPFLTEFPEAILKNRLVTNIDTMFGYNSAEMYTFIFSELLNPSLLKPFHRDFEMQLPKKHLQYDFNSKEYAAIAQEIRKFYFPNNLEIGENTLKEFNQLLSDIWFTYGLVDSARLQFCHSTGKTFSAETNLTIFKQLLGINLSSQNLSGAAHGDEILYLFKTSYGRLSVNYSNFSSQSTEVKLIRLMTKLWSNFAKYGTPTLPTEVIQFRPIQNKLFNYCNINNDGLAPGVNPLEVKVKFWDCLYEKYQNIFTRNVTSHGVM